MSTQQPKLVVNPPVTKVVSPETYTLTLTKREAAVIKALMGRTAGMNFVYLALEPHFPEVGISYRHVGTILQSYFYNLPKEDE